MVMHWCARPASPWCQVQWVQPGLPLQSWLQAPQLATSLVTSPSSGARVLVLTLGHGQAGAHLPESTILIVVPEDSQRNRIDLKHFVWLPKYRCDSNKSASLHLQFIYLKSGCIPAVEPDSHREGLQCLSQRWRGKIWPTACCPPPPTCQHQRHTGGCSCVLCSLLQHLLIQIHDARHKGSFR